MAENIKILPFVVAMFWPQLTAVRYYLKESARSMLKIWLIVSLLMTISVERKKP